MSVNGRPTAYTEDLADEICEAISSSSKSLAALYKEHPNWATPTTIRRWIRTIDSFRHKYAKAKEDQSDLIVDEILEIADDTSKDTIVRTDKNGEEHEVCNSEWIARSRLRVDTRKWLASKLYPKKYSDHKEQLTPDDTKALMQQVIDKL